MRRAGPPHMIVVTSVAPGSAITERLAAKNGLTLGK
jgi:hypothetical protein